MIANSYSADWFDLFLQPIPQAQTEREVAFVHSLLPPKSRILDVPCGAGRHAARLAAQGHSVVAMDRDASILNRDRREGLIWLAADMRRVPLAAKSVDAVICLWQSYGYLDPEGNGAVLSEWARVTRLGGLLVLDLYNRNFFDSNSGERTFIQRASLIHEERSMAGDRLLVQLTYPNGGSDRFDWQLFTRSELEDLAGHCGWALEFSCSRFDARIPADDSSPRVQYALRRVAL